MPETGTRALSLRLRLLDWEAWAQGLPDKRAWQHWAGEPGEARLPAVPAAAATAAAAVPALLRRRAGLSDRLALEVACRLAKPGEALPCVFASRHGQIARSVQLLEALAGGTPLSPMDFSVSVHNATAGLFTMAREDRSPATATAGGREALGAALLDAQGRIEEGAPRVLVVYHDEAPPPVLDGLWDGEAAGWALGLLLGQGQGSILDMELFDGDGDGAAPPERPQALALARLLAQGRGSASWCGGRHRWTWALQA